MRLCPNKQKTNINQTNQKQTKNNKEVTAKTKMLAKKGDLRARLRPSKQKNKHKSNKTTQTTIKQKI